MLFRFCIPLAQNAKCHPQMIRPMYYAATRMFSTMNQNLQKVDQGKQHIVVALGGNALLKRGEALNMSNQRKNIADGISSLSSILKENTISFVHGNGPQVGLLALQGAAYQKETGTEAMDLDVLDAETEGMIGYLLEQEIDAALGQAGRDRGVVTVLSQIIVDPNDPAFQNPTKFIGPVYSKEEAMNLGKPVKQDGEYYRQVVPSPSPIRLIDQQLAAVKLLTKNNCIVICAGGGGIPVVLDDGKLKGIEAVIDKDRAACMIGKTLDADGLMILTDVSGVAINFGTPGEKWIKSTSPECLLELSKNVDGKVNFPPGSMGPKVESAIDFVQNNDSAGKPGKWSMIGSLKDADEMIKGAAGTRITNEYGPEHLEFHQK